MWAGGSWSYRELSVVGRKVSEAIGAHAQKRVTRISRISRIDTKLHGVPEAGYWTLDAISRAGRRHGAGGGLAPGVFQPSCRPIACKHWRLLRSEPYCQPSCAVLAVLSSWLVSGYLMLDAIYGATARRGNPPSQSYNAATGGGWYLGYFSRTIVPRPMDIGFS